MTLGRPARLPGRALAACALAAVAACSPKDTVVKIYYRPIAIFDRINTSPDGNGPISTLAPGTWTLVEIDSVVNNGKDALPFTFRLDHIARDPAQFLYSPVEQIFTPYPVPGFMTPSGFTEGVGAKTLRNYSAAPLRVIAGFKVKDASGPGFLTYTRDPADDTAQRVIMIRDKTVNTAPNPAIATVPYLASVITKSGAPPAGGGGGGTPGGGTPGGGTPGGGSGGTPPAGGTPQTFYFCVTAPGSGASPEEIEVVATTSVEAEAKLKSENLPNGGIGYNIVPGHCTNP